MALPVLPSAPAQEPNLKPETDSRSLRFNESEDLVLN